MNNSIFGKPSLEIFSDYKDLSIRAANLVRECLIQKPSATICLPSGDTPLGMFQELVAMHKQNEINFSNINFIGLDEWVGMDKNDLGSCSNFVFKHFIDPVGLRSEQVHVFDAKAKDLENECKKMDSAIANNGGLDLMVVGVGLNGHIALNEPGYSWNLGCHVSELDQTTITVGQKYFTGETKLKYGITLGLKHLLDSKSAILIASGLKKAPVLSKLFHGPISETFPASVFRIHNKAIVLADKDAASEL